MIYESIFLWQFSMKLLGLPTTKHFLSFILGCPQDFNFARQFWYGWVETGLNGQNGQAKLKSCRHFRVKLKHDLWLASLINCTGRNIHLTSSSIDPGLMHSILSMQDLNVLLSYLSLMDQQSTMYLVEQGGPKCMMSSNLCSPGIF